MAHREPPMDQVVAQFGLDVRTEVDRSIARARAIGQAGDLDAASQEIRAAISHVKRQQLEADRMSRIYTANAQATRVDIGRKGRLITNTVGHGTFGAAVRGSAERQRGAQRARLRAQEADVRTAFQMLRIDLGDMVDQLYQELRLIKDARSGR